MSCCYAGIPTLRKEHPELECLGEKSETHAYNIVGWAPGISRWPLVIFILEIKMTDERDPRVSRRWPQTVLRYNKTTSKSSPTL